VRLRPPRAARRRASRSPTGTACRCRCPEHLEHHLVRGDRRVVDREDHLGVPGAPRADLLVGWVRGEAAGVADRGRVDARRGPELALGTPEAAHAHHDPLEPLGERRHEWRAEHEVTVAHRHGVVTAGECLLGRHQARLRSEQSHRRHLRASDLIAHASARAREMVWPPVTRGPHRGARGGGGLPSHHSGIRSSVWSTSCLSRPRSTRVPRARGRGRPPGDE
jgi:hypothetical protein